MSVKRELLRVISRSRVPSRPPKHTETDTLTTVKRHLDIVWGRVFEAGMTEMDPPVPQLREQETADGLGLSSVFTQFRLGENYPPT